MQKKITADIQLSINASVDDVWEAITNPVKVKQYFFGTDLVTNWKVGQPIFFRGEWEGQAYEDKGTVLQFEPNRMLQYDYWSSFSGKADIPENYQTITYEVEAKGKETLLSIQQTNIDTVEQKDHSEQNWKSVLEGLKKLLEEG